MIQSGDGVKVFRNASIDGGEVTFWVISTLAGRLEVASALPPFATKSARAPSAGLGQKRTHAPQQTTFRVAMIYSITSSASTWIELGTSMPSARAVCRLMTNSNLVDWSYREVGGLRALEDFTGVDAGLTMHVQNIGPIAHQPTGFDIIASGIGH